MEQPLISLSLYLSGRVVTKGRNIKKFVKSQQPLFDVHWQYLQTSLTDLQIFKVLLSNFLFGWTFLTVETRFSDYRKI